MNLWISFIAILAIGIVPAVERAQVGNAAVAEPPIVTYESLLREMTDREAVARWPDPEYRLLQASSFDRRSREGELPSTQPTDEGWFANQDYGNYLRVEHLAGRKEKVLLDARGPGAIVRIWSANPSAGGTLRIYLDEASQPVIEEDFAKLTNGTGSIPAPLSAVRARGHNLYLPIPFATRCKVTLDGDPDDRVYYVINYRQYEQSTAVGSFNPTDFHASQQLLQEAQAALLEPARTVPVRGEGVKTFSRATSEAFLARDGGFELTSGEGPMALRELRVTMEGLQGEALERALRSVVLSIEADEEGKTVNAPLGDFFGSGVGLNPFEDWYRTVDEDGSMTCRWVMPFQRSMTIRFHNQGDEPVKLVVRRVLTDWQWDERSMYFHAQFRQERDVPTRPRQDFNFLLADGPGVYVGDTLGVANPTPVWWGEGDEKIYVDGELFPSHIGTGSEDYYGYAWCSPESFSAPFHAQPRADGPDNFGHVTNTRVRSLDAIPFNARLQFDMEIWHWQDTCLSYAVTTYWYAGPGAKPFGPAVAYQMDTAVPELPRMLRVAGALEGETLKVLARSRDDLPAGAQTLIGSYVGDWSGGRHLWIQARNVGEWVELELPTPGGAGGGQPVELTAWLTRAPDYGIVQFQIDGERIGGTIDLYSAKVGPAEPVTLGSFTPRGDSAVLRIAVVGTNEASTGARHFAGLDAVRLERK